VVEVAVSTVVLPEARLAMVKSASVTSFSAPGVTITYKYLVTNTGSVTITGVKVVDPMPGLSAVTCPSTPLAPTASVTCTATYITTEADVTHGSVANVAVASGTDPSGAVASSGPSKVVIPYDAPTSTLPPTAAESPITPETLPVTG
jgi:uncharacterized repeat protein (TIGR01451 family)